MTTKTPTECERTDGPNDEQRNTNQNAEIHAVRLAN
jgi:hypothetical protein